MELDNTIATPLYRRLKEKLQKKIETGRRPAGSRLSTENELSGTHSVSRVMIRKALTGLSELGYLYRKSGKGTFVAEKRIQRGITNGTLSFIDMCRMMNASPGAKITKIALEGPIEKEMELMSLDKGEKVLVLERIRYADGKLVRLELNRFPESFPFLLSENLNDSSLYEILKKHNITLDHSQKALDIVFATSKEAKALGVSSGYPFLRIESAVHDADNAITNLYRQLCIGDRFKLII